jgi:hypothetical protein
MTKKQHITHITGQLREIADKFGIVLEKKATVHWDEDHKEVYFAVLDLPSKNRVVKALNTQTYIPMFMILDIDSTIRFDVDSEVALECHTDKFNKAALKRLEQHIAQNYELEDLKP